MKKSELKRIVQEVIEEGSSNNTDINLSYAELMLVVSKSIPTYLPAFTTQRGKKYYKQTHKLLKKVYNDIQLSINKDLKQPFDPEDTM